MIKYSIIIPHYNTPELLIRCLESIPESEEIQVIVVDDCSPSASTYPSSYPGVFRKNVEFHSTDKGGSAGRARNKGLRHVKGKWITFIDADDYFVDNFIDILSPFYKDDADILFFRPKAVFCDDLNKESTRADFARCIFENYEKDKDDSKIKYDYSPLWGKFYKAEMILSHNIRCDETPYMNDAGFSLRAGIYARDIRIIQKDIYILTERQGSLAYLFHKKSSLSIEECKTRFIIAFQNYKLAKENNLPIRPNVQIHIDHYRAYHKLAYLRLMGKLLFVQPELFYAEINNFISSKHK